MYNTMTNNNTLNNEISNISLNQYTNNNYSGFNNSHSCFNNSNTVDLFGNSGNSNQNSKYYTNYKPKKIKKY